MEEKKTVDGWVIMNDNHPANPNNLMIFQDTFSFTRSNAIKKFTDGTGDDWKWWKRKYNFKAVRATMTITLNQRTKQ